MNKVPGVVFEPSFFAAHDDLMDELMRLVTWDQSMKARKTASFGKPYDYSQMTYETIGLLPCILPVRQLLVERLSVPFNNCLLNLYETGVNTMGFHSDATENLLSGTGVAIVSLGSERAITFRSKDQLHSVDYSLNPGSMLYMEAGVQDGWLHSIRKHEGVLEPRVSMTWRAVI